MPPFTCHVIESLFAHIVMNVVIDYDTRGRKCDKSLYYISSVIMPQINVICYSFFGTFYVAKVCLCTQGLTNSANVICMVRAQTLSTSNTHTQHAEVNLGIVIGIAGHLLGNLTNRKL